MTNLFYVSKQAEVKQIENKVLYYDVIITYVI